MTQRIFLDPAHEAAFRTEGYVVLDLLGQADVAELLAFYDTVEPMHRSPIGISVLSNNLAQRAAIHAAVGAVFERALLPVLEDYRIALGNYVVKPGNCLAGKFQLHQDPSFIDEGELAGVTLWCPLCDVGADNGYLGIVPRSHLLNQNYRPPGPLPYPQLVPLLEAGFMQYLPMRAGQVLFMDHRMFHGSPANRSAHSRVVAAGVAVPRAQRLLYCHVDHQSGNGMLEIHEVAPDFYLRNSFSERPAEGVHAESIPYQVSALSAATLAAHAQADFSFASTTARSN
ncbi:phytanoyl-CoA dioxygenase family protein [Janthinobacterium sp. HLX7-2]|uniref:phytanoyl-CoA dioxygenase family protein n=1 Tax=Janthinobacterium sp. HLX7-2 TaxID=1259331 RepID=UPI003F1F918A